MANSYNTIIFEISKFIQITVFCHPKPCSQQCLRLSDFQEKETLNDISHKKDEAH